MNIGINTNYNTNNCRKPAFGAELRGRAVNLAIKKASDGFQLGEITEIIGNVELMGDKTTKINCAADGLVTVLNDKFGNIIHKFKLSVNEKAENPFLDLLRSFNSENRIMKLEYDLLDSAFAHTRNQAARDAKFKLYSSYNISSPTKFALKSAAEKNGVVVEKDHKHKTAEETQHLFNKLKNALLESYGDIKRKF